MEKFFNHLFYRIYWWNKTIVKEKDFPVFSSLLGISVFHILNISTLIFIILVYIFKNPMVYPKWIHLIIMFAVLVLDYFIYIHKKRYKEIIKSSENETKISLKRKDYFSLIYIIVSFGLFIWIIIKGRELL